MRANMKAHIRVLGKSKCRRKGIETKGDYRERERVGSRKIESDVRSE